MKNTLKWLTLISLIVALLWSCKKDENKDFYKGGNPPVLTQRTNTNGDSVMLAFADSSKEAIHLLWTNPNYEFTTGISSQNVNYQIQMDTAGSGFTNPNLKVISVNQDLSLSITEAELNDYLLNQLALKDSVAHQIEIRIISSLGTRSAVPLISNVIKFSAVPYAIPPKVPLPNTGHLYIIGNATPGGEAHGWDNPVPVPEKEFTQLSPTKYEITIDLIGGKQFLFIPENGSWTNKYACKSTADQSADGGDFGYNWSDNFPGPAASGTYKITVDFQRGKYTVVKQ